MFWKRSYRGLRIALRGQLRLLRSVGPGGEVDLRTISSGRRTMSMTGARGSESLRSSNLAASVPIW